MRRPNAVTIFGVLSVLFGALGAVALLVSFVMLLTEPSRILAGVWTQLVLCLGLINCFILFVSGVGLLGLNSWARKLSMFYSALGIALGIGSLLMVLSATGQAGSKSGLILGALLGLAYPVILLFFLMQSEVQKAFALAQSQHRLSFGECWGELASILERAFGKIARILFGQQIAAVMGLTWKAAFRFRLFVVVAALLLGAVVLLPVLIKDDGTARGFTQILLTYTLSAITALLGVSTLWLACGTLARDIEDCQMQMVAVKPIARWRIWVGKWLGIMSLNAVLLGISGLGVYVLLQWRATKLPQQEQETLRNEIMVARGSVKPKNAEDIINEQTEKILKERLAKNPVSLADVAEVRKNIREQIKAEFELVPPGYTRTWQLDLGEAKSKLRDRALQLRVKFNSADKSPSGTFAAVWRFGVPRKTALAQSPPMSLAPETFHEFEVPPNMFDEDGIVTVSFLNGNNTTLVFPIDEGIELLYPKGSFGPNFFRGLGVIFCWMGLLAIIGLFAASFLSFPVAAFFAVGVLAVVFSTKTIENAVSEGTLGHFNEENGVNKPTIVDPVIIPVFKVILKVLQLPRSFSPVDSLSTGRDISWVELSRAFGAVVLLLGGPIALMGMGILTRRELATAQGTQ